MNTTISAKPSLWHEGTPEEAFKLASKTKKNLFFYWGALWCPPCNKVKNTIFKKPEFHDAIKNYIAVYLDGDTKEAQTWGEKLKAKGYPTLMILDANQREIARLDAGLSIEEFTKALHLFKNSSHIEDILKQVKSNKEITAQQWSELEYYDWSQDHHELLGSEDSEILTNLKSLFRLSLAQSESIKIKFSLIYLQKLIAKKQKPSIDDLAYLQNSWNLLFKNKVIFVNYIEFLSDLYFDIRKNIFDKTYEQSELTFMSELYQDETISSDSRIYALIPELTHKQELIGLTKSQLSELQGKTEAIVKKIQNAEELQATMSAAIYLHYKVKNYDHALALTDQAMLTSKTPFYFTNYKVMIYKALSKSEEILKWSQKGWLEAVGESTRLEQGVRYLSNLVTYKQDLSLLFDHLSLFMEPIIANPTLMSGRGRSYLTRLQTSLSSLPVNKLKLLKSQTDVFCTKRKYDCKELMSRIF